MSRYVARQLRILKHDQSVKKTEEGLGAYLSETNKTNDRTMTRGNKPTAGDDAKRMTQTMTPPPSLRRADHDDSRE
eukprot:scaffold164856_cov69-Cyclotella_meneghiniana.AAC.1